MTRAHRLNLATLLLVVAIPPAWLACGGGESKPAESPSSDTSASASSEAPAASDTAAPAASESAAPAADTASASAEPAAASPPPAPSLGSTDCGKCIDKTCAKQETACGKNSDCQSTLDGIHGCSSGAAACIESATAPTDPKPKKLAGAFETCAKHAVAKACKAKCE